MDNIRIGYGSDQRRKNPKNCYGTRSTGKVMMNGGFNFAPTVSFENVSDARWAEIFENENLPKWKQDLLNEGKSLD